MEFKKVTLVEMMNVLRTAVKPEKENMIAINEEVERLMGEGEDRVTAICITIKAAMDAQIIIQAVRAMRAKEEEKK